MTWVLDMDIQGLFDNIDHNLLMKAVDRHVIEDWQKLYIRRDYPEIAFDFLSYTFRPRLIGKQINESPWKWWRQNSASSLDSVSPAS